MTDASKRWAAETAAGAVDRPRFRVVVTLALAATIAMTWRLWQARDGALPNLPLVAIPQMDVGVVLLVALAGVVVRPRWGIPAFTALAVIAMAMDQTRMQPTVVSLTFMLWATRPFPAALALCRAHLVSLWFFAGAHKLLSPEFIAGWGRGFQERHLWDAGDFSLPAFAVAMTELGLGMIMLIPRTRRHGAWLALAVHLGILLLLGPLGRSANTAVWAWNVVLALSGFVFFWRWRASPDKSLAKLAWPARLAAVILFVAPAGYYIGFVDAYLAHCLYSKNTPSAVYRGEPVVDLAMREVNVPLPPERRLYEQLFERTAAPGDEMRIVDPRFGERTLSRE